MKPFVRLVLLVLLLGVPAQIVDQEVHRVVFHVVKG
jgi:hypothetical protein